MHIAYWITGSSIYLRVMDKSSCILMILYSLLYIIHNSFYFIFFFSGSIDICLPNLIIGPRDQKIMRIIKKKTSKTVIDGIVDQLFGKFCIIELKLLHIFKQRYAIFLFLMTVFGIKKKSFASK